MSVIVREEAIKLIQRELEFLGSRETDAAVCVLLKMPAAAPEGRLIDSVMIRGKLPSLNEYINAERTNKHIAAKIKRETDQLICWQIMRMKTINKKIRIVFTWYEETKRRDPDNVAFAKKFILDAMQKCGKLKNDNASWIACFKDDFVYGSGQGVLLEIIEY